MSGTAIRNQFVGEFRRLAPNRRFVAALTVGSYLLQVLAAIGLGCWLLQLPFSGYTAAAIAVLMLFIGTRLRGFNNIVHECTHFAFSERREDNVLLGKISAALILASFRDYRDQHMTHHTHVGDYDHDQDMQRIRTLRLEEPLTPRTMARHVFTIISGRYLPYYLSPNLSARDGRAFQFMKLGLIALASLFLILDPIPALLLVWLPYLWVFTAINYATDCIDHAGLIGSGDELEFLAQPAAAQAPQPAVFPAQRLFSPRSSPVSASADPSPERLPRTAAVEPGVSCPPQAPGVAADRIGQDGSEARQRQRRPGQCRAGRRRASPLRPRAASREEVARSSPELPNGAPGGVRVRRFPDRPGRRRPALRRGPPLQGQARTRAPQRTARLQAVTPISDPRRAGGGDRTPTPIRETDFLTSYGFRRPLPRLRGGSGLWSGLSLHHSPAEARVHRCRPSSLYTFRGHAGPRLGSGFPAKGSPNLSGSTSRVSPGALSLQVRCVCQFRHARVTRPD